MHILAQHNRSEFLATPQLIRFDHVQGQNGFEPTLLIKGSTLLLKYIVSGVRMQLGFARMGERLLYALKVFDDEQRACVLWSIAERDEEKAALDALVRGEICQIFLFNELAVNVAWAALPLSVGAELMAMASRTTTGPADHRELKDDASLIIDRFHSHVASTRNLIISDVPGTTAWNPIASHFITSRATSSLVDLFAKNEGSHQEQLGIWLTDSLNPLGVHHSPQIPKGKGFRELTDILLSHEFGSILVESKVLSVFSRDSLPNRTKLTRDVSASIAKAVKQLRGGIRQIRKGTAVTSMSGELLQIERKKPTHGIILIPDLDLIEDRSVYGLPFIREFMKATGGFLHLLDISELLRMVQAAEMIAARGKTTTPMMAFDYYLLERVKKTVEAGTLCIEVLLRFSEK